MKGQKFEQAVRILVEYFPVEIIKKPTLFHCLRVGSFLWNNDYSEEIQVAGLLHDIIEDTDIDEKLIEEKFGKNILDIIKANSEDESITVEKQKEDIVRRCYLYGEEAIIVKIADVYDNFLYYKKTNNLPEIERCKDFAKLIEYGKTENWDIYKYLEQIKNG